jgi:tetratricopeptide (TPR) repeat protein
MAALTKSKREQVKYAIEVRDEAVRTLELDPRHDGALHILGRWHAEIKRLSNIEEFFAKKFLGAKVFSEASWAEAARNLEMAVALRPDYVYHRLDLGEIYVEMKRYAEARVQFEAIPGLPTQDVLDPEYRQQAARQLSRLADQD